MPLGWDRAPRAGPAQPAFRALGARCRGTPPSWSS